MNTGQVVRIFTSSTFTDMLMERNCLMEYVYPKIKEYCREKHGLEYQVISIKSINSIKSIRCRLETINFPCFFPRWWT